ncbi:XRE family transcriptional regulator [Pararhodospirillum oryzae]|uniref:XRE family transcriptional regulator n=1 Tax=Pararhodospirillum oryzae TaxID=478448 RepID=A0A512H776_9PROT|nr:helix-turn-helix domain-containing protein [Pararhodospirillum oryzae]GEO81315.1 XRE family transcriptional regulator [Pararhodospirillum oryzae]
MNEIGQRIAQARKELGLSQYALANLLGVNQSTVAYYERGRNIPKPWIVEDIARLLNVSASYLLYGREHADPPVPIMGRVEAGGVVVYEAETPTETVEAPPGVSSRTEALRVEGDALWPVYRAGDLLFHAVADLHRAPEEVWGRDCVVRTASGATLVRLVKRGRTRALFTLAAFNAPDEEDVALDMAAPIRWIRRGL